MVFPNAFSLIDKPIIKGRQRLKSMTSHSHGRLDETLQVVIEDAINVILLLQIRDACRMPQE